MLKLCKRLKDDPCVYSVYKWMTMQMSRPTQDYNREEVFCLLLKHRGGKSFELLVKLNCWITEYNQLAKMQS